jgi:hypothetical protein
MSTGGLTPGFMFMSVPTFNNEEAFFVRCSVCTGGTADPSTLSFSIGNRSINDFMPNMGGVFFTADIFGGALGAQGDPIFRVGSDRRVFDPVPEPTFYLALAVGVGALFFTAKRKASSKQS